MDVAFFATEGSITRELAPDAVNAGCLVMDKSSAFRMDPAVPLVIPEINPEALRNHHGIIANPNCSTSVTLMALWPLHQRFGLKRYIAATYQSVSGTGTDAIAELEGQIQAYAKGCSDSPEVYPYQIAFNVIPQVDSFGPDGYTGEETKITKESRKIMGLPNLKVSATCVRVPVVRAHSVAINTEFERPVRRRGGAGSIAAFEGADPVERLGRIAAGRMIVILDRGDYWQCAFVIAKGGSRRRSRRPRRVPRGDCVSRAAFADRSKK